MLVTPAGVKHPFVSASHQWPVSASSTLTPDRSDINQTTNERIKQKNFCIGQRPEQWVILSLVGTWWVSTGFTLELHRRKYIWNAKHLIGSGKLNLPHWTVQIVCKMSGRIWQNFYNSNCKRKTKHFHYSNFSRTFCLNRISGKISQNITISGGLKITNTIQRIL